MKYYLIAGEASGDLHGSNLMKQLQVLDPAADFRFWGGDKMLAVGGTMVEHYRNTAFMGFLEVIKNLSTILNFIKKCKKDIAEYAPDVLILIDYPGFNLRIAKWAKPAGFKVVYYIVPQVWAWHKSRIHDLDKYTDRLLVILPFETAFFRKYGYETTYTGHPLLDEILVFKSSPDFESKYHIKKEIIALLPGSRMQEIKLILPIMLRAIKSMDRDLVLAGAPSIPDDIYLQIIEKEQLTGKVILVRNETYEILSRASCALVGSGTATLETALFRVPQIVCYKGGKISYMIAKKLVDLKYISLVNLIAGKEVVKELIQNDLTPENINLALDDLNKNRQKVLNDYNQLILDLGKEGASRHAAESILQTVHS